MNLLISEILVHISTRCGRSNQTDRYFLLLYIVIQVIATFIFLLCSRSNQTHRKFKFQSPFNEYDEENSEEC